MTLNFNHINASEQILLGSITTPLLADGSVTSTKLAIGAITSSSLTVNSNLSFNEFQALQFRIENLTSNPIPGNPGRLIWRTDVNDLYIDADLAITISNVSNASFYVTTVTDGTHLVVSSTTGITAGDLIVQGINSTTVTTVTDATHLVVGSTTGFVGVGVASVNFGVVTVTDGTHLVVDNTIGMQPGYVITQGIHSTTVTSVTDSTHVVVASTTGFIPGLAVLSVPFNIVTVTDATHLVVSSTTGMGIGDTIMQGLTSTTITAVTDTTHLVVSSTSGLVANSASDTTLTVSSTTGISVGMYVTQGATASVVNYIVDATHLSVASSTGFVTGSALVGSFLPILEGAAVTSIHADSNPNLTGAIQLVSGTNVTLSQVGQTITINVSDSTSEANTSLSNLTSPTALNQDILPASDGIRSLGSSSLQFEQLYAYNVISHNDDLDLTSAFNVYLASGAGFDIILNSGSGHINADAHSITNMADPISAQDAVTKHYVDTNFLMLTGGTLTGTLNMGQNQIFNLVLQKGTSEPGSPVEGQLFYRTDTHQAELWNGTSWVLIG